jgi:rRNA-processing protein FCF1
MKRIFLDTNFLIDLVRFRIEIERISALLEEPHQIFILSSVINELERIANKKGKSSNFARLALEMIRLKKIKTIRVEGENPDKTFLSMADKNTIIATNDRKLRIKLKGLGIKTVYLRAKKRLAMG